METVSLSTRVIRCAPFSSGHFTCTRNLRVWRNSSPFDIKAINFYAFQVRLLLGEEIMPNSSLYFCGVYIGRKECHHLRYRSEGIVIIVSEH
jgi:hypothetical protein